jgi:hypothetical protein
VDVVHGVKGESIDAVMLVAVESTVVVGEGVTT